MKAKALVSLVSVGMAVVLSGCAMAMLKGAAGSGANSGTGGSGISGQGGTGAATTGGRAPSQIAADNATTSAVRSKLAADAGLRLLNVGVDTHDGVVTLRGQVNNVQQRNAAQLAAHSTNGVKAVRNELVVR